MHPPAEEEVHLIAVGKVISRQPITELYPVLNTAQDQWITRHEMDGQITYSDPRLLSQTSRLNYKFSEVYINYIYNEI